MKCPWCEKSIDFPAQLGARPTKDSPKWYRLSLSGSYKTVNVCPYCNGAVKITAKGQLWMLLLLPSSLVIFAKIFWPYIFGSMLIMPKFIFPSLVVLSIIGIIMYCSKMQLEKANEI